MKNRLCRRVASLALGTLLLASLSGCGVLAGAAVGTAAGYKMKQEGYKFQSPVTKE
ncbi:MAG: hypothetical protein AAF555_10940 [Verrucomicrobiota bacterium]